MSVYLWRKGERMVKETRFEHCVTPSALTVYQPTEIVTNTGSVSYPKREHLQRSQDKSQGTDYSLLHLDLLS